MNRMAGAALGPWTVLFGAEEGGCTDCENAIPLASKIASTLKHAVNFQGTNEVENFMTGFLSSTGYEILFGAYFNNG
jgi:hypothetical protein